MINTQKTGAYISQLRKQQNMTQADMAAKLTVSPQAVSKWETGLALPDPEQLLTLSQLFSVSVNAILLGEDTQSTAPSHPEPVAARMAAPVSEPTDQPKDPATVVRLAPFVLRDVLQEMINACGLEAFTLRQVVMMAPFVGSEWLSQYAARVERMDIESLEALAPFLHPESLDRLIAQLEAPLTTRQLARLAPFLRGERLWKLFQSRAAGEQTFDQVAALAPFLPKALLNEALEAQPPQSLPQLARVAPFLDAEFVNQLARHLMGK